MATAPQQIDPDLQTGTQYLRAGWFDRAEPLFRAAHGRYGDRPDILHCLAVCATQRGALDDAADLWRKAIAKDPREPMLSFNLGLVMRRMGQFDEAARRFRDTIRLKPEHIEARLSLASIHMDQGKFTAAERELSDVATNLDRAIGQPDGAGLKPLQAGTVGLSDGAIEVGRDVGELALGGGELALVHVNGGERQACLYVFRLEADRVAEAPRGLVELAHPAHDKAEVERQHRLPGILCDRLAPQVGRVVQRAALRGADGKTVKDVG